MSIAYISGLSLGVGSFRSSRQSMKARSAG
jgi:hypothetical protein